METPKSNLVITIAEKPLIRIDEVNGSHFITCHYLNGDILCSKYATYEAARLHGIKFASEMILTVQPYQTALDRLLAMELPQTP